MIRREHFRRQFLVASSLGCERGCTSEQEQDTVYQGSRNCENTGLFKSDCGIYLVAGSSSFCGAGRIIFVYSFAGSPFRSFTTASYRS